MSAHQCAPPPPPIGYHFCGQVPQMAMEWWFFSSYCTFWCFEVIRELSPACGTRGTCGARKPPPPALHYRGLVPTPPPLPPPLSIHPLGMSSLFLACRPPVPTRPMCSLAYLPTSFPAGLPACPGSDPHGRYKATADPGRPRRSEARHMPMPMHTCIHTLEGGRGKPPSLRCRSGMYQNG